jgi:hypothetical protein
MPTAPGKTSAAAFARDVRCALPLNLKSSDTPTAAGLLFWSSGLPAHARFVTARPLSSREPARLVSPTACVGSRASDGRIRLVPA